MGINKYWDQIHRANFLDNRVLSNSVSEHAITTLQLIPPSSKVLDIGCGTGYDSNHFSQQGHHVIALDVAQSAIDYCKETHKSSQDLTFETHDIKEPFKFSDSFFDLVYARLSLHYFTDTVTKNIFREIARVLKPEGKLVFICKSIEDPSYGLGDHIEENMYSHNGHVRHFFSLEYSREICEQEFKIENLESLTDELYGKPSAYVQVIATKN